MSMRKLAGPEKAAALLLAMGKPAASRVLKYFDEEEIRQVARHAAGLGTVPRTILEEAVQEFAEGVASGGELRGSSNEAEKLLTGILAPDQIAGAVAGVNADGREPVWPRLAQVPEATVAKFLQKEHPQIAAAILSKVSPACAAAVLGQIPNDLRNELVRRILSIKYVMERPLKLLEDAIHADVLASAARTKGEDVHARLADIINKMDRQQMDDVLQSLTQHRPKEAKQVRGLLFTFDDIANLSEAARGKLIDQVPPERLILALKGADAKLGALILSAVSARSRRMIEQELASGAQPNPKDVAKARRAIADQALEMAERGQIELRADEVQE